jgi:hypothetical protein
MKKALKVMMVLVLVASIFGGCAYGGMAMPAAGGQVVITRNDLFLYGALRKVFVCKVTDSGLSGCAEGEAP